ncbi:MAG: hypothetical protein LBD85_06080 [Oscillospiraceae bacterium]|jgi:hypothetical protein|nr:hypothetical protein [Oscillospiraceae bacterium]
MENGGEKKGFQWWWHNVFAYHYLKIVLVSLAAAAVVVFLTIDALNTVRFDLGVAIVTGFDIPDESLRSIRSLAAETIGDLNGDGEVNIDIRTINLNGNELGSGEVNYQHFELAISKAENLTLVFLLDDKQSRIHGERGDFDSAERLGLNADSDETWYRVYVGDSPAIKALPDAPSGQSDWGRTEYLCLETWKAANAESADAAIRLARVLANGNNQVTAE